MAGLLLDKVRSVDYIHLFRTYIHCPPRRLRHIQRVHINDFGIGESGIDDDF